MTGADEIDIAFPVDLAAAQEEGVDAPLRGAVVELAAAVVERVVTAAAEDAGPGAAVALGLDQQRRRCRHRRVGADGDIAQPLDHPREHAGEKFVRRWRRAHAASPTPSTCRSSQDLKPSPVAAAAA